MKIIDNVRKKVFNEELEIRVFINKVYVANYTKIGYIDSKMVSLYSTDKEILIIGNNLIISRLLNDEILIDGTINKVELR